MTVYSDSPFFCGGNRGHDAEVSIAAPAGAHPAPDSRPLVSNAESRTVAHHANAARITQRGERLLQALILGYTLLYTALCWRRFATFHAQIDMSYYLRLIWGLGHGHSDLPLVRAPHVLGLHLEPGVLPLCVLGRLGVPLPPLLLFTQALAVALLAWPAYRMGARHLVTLLPTSVPSAQRPPIAGLLAALCALIYPTVTVATLHDFHPVTLALTPLLFVIEGLEAGAPRRAFLAGLLALSCREDIALQLACLLFAYSLRPAATRPLSRRTACILVGLLLLYCGVYLLVIQPRFVPAVGSYHLHFDRIAAALGTPIGSSRDLVLAALRHPLRMLAFFATSDRLLYPLLLLFPVAFLGLLSPLPLAGALPIVGINFLSGFPGVLRLESHYTTAIVPFVLGAGILGAGRLGNFLSRRAASDRLRWGCLAALFFCGFFAHLLHGGSPLALLSTRFAWRDFIDGKEAPGLRRQIAAVPPSASVAARPGPLAHLAERPRAMSPPEYDDGKPTDVTIGGEKMAPKN